MSKTKLINFLTNATERLIKFQITMHILILLVIKLQCQLDSQPCQISYSECQGILGENSRSQRIVLGLKVRFGVIRASQPLNPTWISIVTWRTSLFLFWWVCSLPLLQTSYPFQVPCDIKPVLLVCPTSTRPSLFPGLWLKPDLNTP